jgi:hypothetical protein
MTQLKLADVNLRCASCGDPFVFTAGEQELYRLRGLAQRPSHCPTCARGGRASLAQRSRSGGPAGT